jgi:chemotaxis protein CheD
LPGEFYCGREPHLVGTILGSCVAVCLWDRRLRFGGMNHFVLPVQPATEAPSVRFGDVAIPALVEGMIGLGSAVEDLQAKVFGGASVLVAAAGGVSVGRRNLKLAVAELRRRRIPIVAGRLAGDQGIILVQCTACGDVWVRPIAPSGAAVGARRRLPLRRGGGSSVGEAGAVDGNTCPACEGTVRSGEPS